MYIREGGKGHWEGPGDILGEEKKLVVNRVRAASLKVPMMVGGREVHSVLDTGAEVNGTERCDIQRYT